MKPTNKTICTNKILNYLSNENFIGKNNVLWKDIDILGNINIIYN